MYQNFNNAIFVSFVKNFIGKRHVDRKSTFIYAPRIGKKKMDKKKINEPLDHVALMKTANEASRKNKMVRLRWLNDYEWLCDEYKNVRCEMKKLCEEKNITEDDFNGERDDRSALPLPETTNGLYGWLAAKKDFNLEIYGPRIVDYPNPLDEITLLPGNIPTLAAGKGLI